ncbi:DUF2339 domain-containing protein [Oleiharenicola lentus]|uniref:DUF2339 domain-containing protein n=1 Tax=Oleiharenicola lentus TaxID=2508720 RepID=UPI003F6646BA
MQLLFVLLVLYLVVALIVLPIWTFAKLSGQNRENESLRRRLDLLDEETKTLRQAVRRLETVAASAPPAAAPAAQPQFIRAKPIEAAPQPVIVAAIQPPAPVVVPPAPIIPAPAVSPSVPPPIPRSVTAHEPTPAPGEELAAWFANAEASAQTPPPVYVPPPEKPSWLDNINWEQFMGAKLFAWLGGLALFLGIAFFVKYSFDHDLIPPAVRVAIGFVLGAGLVAGGLKMARGKYAITAQTLIAAGIVSLYAVTFACRSIYHFEFFGAVPTFLLMTLITATAFVLAVRLSAQVVAVLGILGGFLTPLLISTGQDNPLGLFGYLALLDLGLIAVALHRSWFYLVPLGAGGTTLLMLGWAGKFYTEEKTFIAMTVCVVFTGIFFAALEIARKLNRPSPLLSQTVIGLVAVAFGFSWFFLNDRAALSTGLFFGFVFVLTLTVFALAWREKVHALVAGAAMINGALICRWAAGLFTPENAPVIMAVCTGFSGIYFAAFLVARRFAQNAPAILWSAVGLPALSLAIALFMIVPGEIGARPGLLFGFIFVSDVLLLAIAWRDERVPRLHAFAGMACFALLSLWTAQSLTDALLPWALGACLGFAALHTVFPLLLERKNPASAPTWWSQLFPPLALVLMLFPIFKLETTSFLIWPAILLVDLLAVILAVFTASLVAVAAVLVLTLFATGVSVLNVPVTTALSGSQLLVIGFFAVFFFAASLWLARKLGDLLPESVRANRFAGIFGTTQAQLPAFASLLPFILLVMVCARLSVPDPSAVFGLGLLLVVLTLGLARLLVIAWLPACALAGIVAVEYAWHAKQFSPAEAGLPLAWHLGFLAVFSAFPFLFREKFIRLTGPWAVAALAGPAHFWLIHDTIKLGWPNEFLGAVPALLSLVPLLGLSAILKLSTAENPARLNQLAWFGGVGLFFITLVFPVQFERQWLTAAWALEGAALLWLFHRVPHAGLRATGTALLVIAFVRLALNPAVLGYHVRGDTPIFNWYLYAYGLTAAALFTAARLAAAPRDELLGIKLPPVFNAGGLILPFLLLNIEIADYFTPAGSRSLVFQFSGNFARDMSYTIGWALFALVLLGLGLWKKTRVARYAAIALLSVTLLKLFFHDLSRLEALYRVGALFAVAIIAMLASFAYQRFLPSHEKTPPPQP